jgi:hypothetical protein
MIFEDIKKIKSGKKELRQFGITISVVLGILGCWFLWREKQWYFYLFIVSLTFLSFGFLLPSFLKPLHKLWMAIGLVIGWFVTGVIMIVLFYLVVTPIGLFMRVRGKDLLNRRFDSKAESYWIPREAVIRNKQDYEKQF